jgi:hypothetical protein
MTTTFVSIKEFRQNIASFAADAQTMAGKKRYIVMSHSKPLFEIKPFARNTKLDALMADIAAAEDDIKHGRLHSHQEVLEALGLND